MARFSEHLILKTIRFRKKLDNPSKKSVELLKEVYVSKKINIHNCYLNLSHYSSQHGIFVVTTILSDLLMTNASILRQL